MSIQYRCRCGQEVVLRPRDGVYLVVGLLVGATVGYFDTWGPFDLLRFEAHSDELGLDVRGMVLPYADDGEYGVRMGLTF